MVAQRKYDSQRSSRYNGYNKMKARTERMQSSVRYALCFFVLTVSLAFLATTLKPYRELETLNQYYVEEVQELEKSELEKVDAKEREYYAIENDPQYLGLIARDTLNYYKPGEHVFRVER